MSPLVLHYAEYEPLQGKNFGTLLYLLDLKTHTPDNCYLSIFLVLRGRVCIDVTLKLLLLDRINFVCQSAAICGPHLLLEVATPGCAGRQCSIVFQLDNRFIGEL